MNAIKPKTILHTEAATGFGGQQIRILDELTGLTQRGYRMMLAAPNASRLFQEAKKREIDTVAVPFTRKTFPISIYHILQLIKRHEVDVVSTHSSRDSWQISFAARLSSHTDIGSDSAYVVSDSAFEGRFQVKRVTGI